MIKYGLISETDARTLEKTLDLIFEQFPEGVINVTEIGLYAGETGNGLREYAKSKGREIFLTGIDSGKDKEPLRFEYNRLIIGDSTEVYSQIENNSQHLIFMDGCHCFSHVVSDFFCYIPKVKKEGYMAWHDAGMHIKPFKDFQHGDKNNPLAYISVRKALEEIGAMDIDGRDYILGVDIVFDDADISDPAGGICVFRNNFKR